MKHNMNELFHIKGDPKIYSAKAVEFVNQPKLASKAQKGDAVRINSKTNNGKPFRIFDEIGSKEYRLGYLYGEKTWFDTQKELDDHRKKSQEERIKTSKKNELLKKLEKLSISELEKLVNKMQNEGTLE